MINIKCSKIYNYFYNHINYIVTNDIIILENDEVIHFLDKSATSNYISGVDVKLCANV